jgi:hypothetical protein
LARFCAFLFATDAQSSFRFYFSADSFKKYSFLCVRLEHEEKARNDDEIEIGYYIMLSSTRRHQAEKKRRLDLEKTFLFAFG